MKIVHCIADIHEKDYLVYAIAPLAADKNDPEQLRKMAEFVCRANYGHKDGNFEMDFNDGELRYRCFVNCNGAIPPRNIIGASIECPAAMFNRYCKGIEEILFTDISAADAIELCEGKRIPTERNDSNEEISSRLIEMLQRLQSGYNSTEEDTADNNED